jgi:hypothetical protein
VHESYSYSSSRFTHRDVNLQRRDPNLIITCSEVKERSTGHLTVSLFRVCWLDSWRTMGGKGRVRACAHSHWREQKNRMHPFYVVHPLVHPDYGRRLHLFRGFFPAAKSIRQVNEENSMIHFKMSANNIISKLRGNQGYNQSSKSKFFCKVKMRR